MARFGLGVTVALIQWLAGVAVVFAGPPSDLPTGWSSHAPRDEIRPAFAFDPRGARD